MAALSALTGMTACSTTGAKMPPPSATYQLQKSPISPTEINQQIKESIETVERQKRLLAQTKSHNPAQVSPNAPYPLNQAQYATDPSGVRNLTHKEMREVVRTGQTATRPDNYDPIQEDGVSAGHPMAERIRDFQFERGIPQDVSPSVSMRAVSLSQLAKKEPDIPVRSFGKKNLNNGLTPVRLDRENFLSTPMADNTKGSKGQFAKKAQEQKSRPSGASLDSEIQLKGRYDVKELIREIARQTGYKLHLSGYDTVPDKYKNISFAEGYKGKVSGTLEHLHNTINTVWKRDGHNTDLINMEITAKSKTMKVEFKGAK